MSWLYYLAEANIYLVIFYLAYCLFLNRDTHYRLKRIYLIFSCIISFIIPLLQIGVLTQGKYAETSGTVINTMPPVQVAVPVRIVKFTTKNPQTVASTLMPKTEDHFTVKLGLWYSYLVGVACLLVMFLIKLYALFSLAYNKKGIKDGNHTIIYLAEKDVAFSFFNYLFIGTNATEAGTIIRHELVHIRQRHSIDILFLELLKIINWFNPVVYLLMYSLKTVHEYIADEQTAAFETDILTYSSFLLKNAYGTGGSSIAHSFFNYNLLKKRIIMLNQQRSGNLARLKYLVVVPIFMALICASTLVFSKTYGWVDLAPANTRSTSRHVMSSTHAPVKKKRLKITQNGVSTITDRFAVGQKNKKVIYTAGTITTTDRSLLLKNNNIKVELVEDSTLFKTSDGRLILPGINVDGYYLLDHFLHNNIHYTPTKGEKGGLVQIGFSLDKGRNITNAKVVKSGGAKLDALALNGFEAYKGIVNDDAGKKLKIGVYFFNDDYSIFKTDSHGKDPEFSGELIITSYKYPVSVTAKGYEYDESGIGFPGIGNDMSNAKVVFYEKNGGATWYYYNKCITADFKLLKDKYGYSFPSAASTTVQFMHPQGAVNKRLAYVYDVASYLDAPYANDFYNFIIDSIRYPQQAKKALTGGVVVLNFNLNNEGIISGVNAQNPDSEFAKAAVAALQSYKQPIKDKAGKHSISVLFCVTEKKYRPTVSNQMKQEGYVGELAVLNAKSPFFKLKKG